MEYTDTIHRQFDRLARRFGRIVRELDSGKDHIILFQKTSAANQSATDTQERLKFSYPQSYGWKKGTIFQYQNHYWMIVRQSAHESEYYFTSIAQKVTTIWNINGKTFYILVDETLGSMNPSAGSYLSSVSGSITAVSNQTGILNINDGIVDFGGQFTCVNVVTIDGLTHYILQRTEVSTDWNLSFGTTQTSYDISTLDSVDYSASLRASNGTGTVYDAGAKYSYTSSDESLATIDQNGMVTFIKPGTVRINCNAIASTGKKYTVSAELVLNGDSVTASIECYHLGSDDKRTYLSDGLRYNLSYYLVAHYMRDGVEDTSMIPSSWEMTSEDATITVDESAKTISVVANIGGGDIYEDAASYSIAENTAYVKPSTRIDRSQAWYYAEPTVKITYADGTMASLTLTFKF